MPDGCPHSGRRIYVSDEGEVREFAPLAQDQQTYREMRRKWGILDLAMDIDPALGYETVVFYPVQSERDEQAIRKLLVEREMLRDQVKFLMEFSQGALHHPRFSDWPPDSDRWNALWRELRGQEWFRERER